MRGNHPEGTGIAIGMAIGIAVGLALGVLPMGIVLGVSLGVAIEESQKDRLRPMTAGEKKKQKQLLGVGLVVLLLAMLAYALTR